MGMRGPTENAMPKRRSRVKREVVAAHFPVGPFLDTAAAAHRLRVIERRVRFLIKSGELKAERIGGRWYMRIRDVEAYDQKRKKRAREALAIYGSANPKDGPVPMHLPNIRQASRILQGED